MDDEFPPRVAVERAWTIIWPLMPMLMPLIIDVVHWSVTCVTDGKRVKAILKN